MKQRGLRGLAAGVRPNVIQIAFLSVILLSVTLWSATPLRAAEAVNVYSYRQAFLIEPLFEAFEEKTGIHVNVLFAKAGLIERIALEGRASPADLLLAVDIGQLVQAGASIGRQVRSDTLEQNIPANYRDPQHRWFGLTRRARVAFVSRARAKRVRRLTYESLAGKAWRGRICMREGNHPYNIGLVAAMISHHGREETRTWLAGVKENLARRPAGNDRAQIRAVFAGECDMAIANTYYMGKMLKNPAQAEQKNWARAVRIILPSFKNGGTHVNLSGMVMPRYAPNRRNARALMTFLSSAEGQRIYAAANYEYPVRPDATASSLVRGWGRLNADRVPLATIARNRAEAALLMDEVGFND